MNLKRLGVVLWPAMEGALLGFVLGYLEAYLAISTSANLLGFGDQDGMLLLAAAPFGALHGGVVGLLIGLGVRNVRGWVLGALAGLGLWAPLFLWGGRRESNVTMLVASVMPLWCGGVGALVQARFARKEKPQRRESSVEVLREDH